MSSPVKNLLENMAKNAVNACLTAAGPIGVWHSFFYFSNWTGLKHILLIMGSAVVAREVMVYGPKLLQWSASTTSD